MSSEFIFTPCGASGRTGPTQAQLNSAYKDTALEGLVTSNEGIQQFTIPRGAYKIVAKGSAAADLTKDGAKGGLGAIVSTTVYFEEPTVINIVVGQKGPADSGGTGGGGGTFVYTGEPGGDGLLIAAGGGGGCGHNNANGANASITNEATRGTTGNKGTDGFSDLGNNGVGNGGKSSGNGYSTNYGGPGGGGTGWLSSGDGGSKGGNNTTFLGGTGSVHGGFGGGGCAEGSGKSPGGGGGYSGGGAGMSYIKPDWGGAGGGGSFAAGIDSTFDVNTINEQGSVTITSADIKSVMNFTYKLEGRTLTLSWVNPPNNPDFAGIKLIKNTTNIPADSDDGEVLLETNDTTILTYSERVNLNRIYYYSIYSLNPEGEIEGYGASVTVDTRLIETSFPKQVTTCGKTGRTAPTQDDANKAYLNTNLKGQITVENGKQYLTVPKKGVYTFTVCGAKGGAGNGSKSQPACVGGFGAKLKGDIKLNAKDKLEMLVGQRGTDHSGTGGDGTTGAGGGGTFLVYHPYNAESDSYDEPILLVAAAGGNGGRDYGYSGSGNLYHGLATTPSSAPSMGSYQGGGYNTSSNDTSTGGRSFLEGGAAATSTYSRGGSSDPGFGGGGANKDDGEGGGGGGYYGGHLTASAYSYINEELFTNIDRVSGFNNGNGYIDIEANLTVSGYFMRNQDDLILYYNDETTQWEELPGEFDVDFIELYSKTILPFELTKLVENGTILKCKDELDGSVDYEVVSLPLTNVIIQEIDFDTTGKVIVGIELVANSDVSIIVSCDEGTTWKYFSDENWVEYTDDYNGMSIDVFNTLSKNIWLNLGYKTTNKLRVGFIINSTNYENIKVNSFKIKTIDE